MLTYTLINQDSESAANPADLSRGLERDAFLRLVFEAVHSVEWPASSGPAAHPALLRTLLTYCYATGLYDSREIERAASHDPAVRYICAHHPPSWNQIRQFRRQFREPLRQVLAQLASLLNWRGRPSSAWLADADARLLQAIRADSMALDV